MKYVVLLGSTGSIGTQTLTIIKKYPQDFKLVALSLGSNEKLNKKIIQEFQSDLEFIILRNKDQQVYYRNQKNLEVFSDENDLDPYLMDINNNIYKKFFETILRKYDHNDLIIVNALSGLSGLFPSYYSSLYGLNLALANKESLVVAGSLIMKLARENNAKIVPIDSEHSSLYKLLSLIKKTNLKKAIITASGGALRDYTLEQCKTIELDKVLNHPTWKMGKKITVESAAMLNKGYEIIEAHHLFKLPYSKIDAVIERNSNVHAMVLLNNNHLIPELCPNSMLYPIMEALFKFTSKKGKYTLVDEKQYDYCQLKIEFESINTKRYRLYALALKAGRLGGYYPTILNALNEVSIKLLLSNKINYYGYEQLILKNFKKIFKQKIEEYSKTELSISDIVKFTKEIDMLICKEYHFS